MTTHPLAGADPSLSDVGGPLSGGLGNNLSSDFAPARPGGSSGVGLGGGGSANSAPVILGGDANALGAHDSAAAWSYYIGLLKPISINPLPQSATSDSSTGAMAPTATLVDDYGSVSPQSGPPVVDLFAKPGGVGGGGGGGGGGSGTSKTYTDGNPYLTFQINYDSSVNNAPGGFTAFEAGFHQAVDYFLSTFTDPIEATRTGGGPLTITLGVGYGEVAGQKISRFALGESSTNIEQRSYSDFQPAMAAMGSLPSAGDPISGTHTYWAATAEEKALGLGVQDKTLTSDGAVGFGSSVSWDFTGSPAAGSKQYDFIGVAEHEISETLGRIALVGGTVSDNGVNYANSYTPFDLFRFSDISGTRSLTGGSTAYFSFDGGATSDGNAADSKTFFNTKLGGDYGDWQTPSPTTATANDAYDAYASAGYPYAASNVDHIAVNALGYAPTPTTGIV